MENTEKFIAIYSDLVTSFSTYFLKFRGRLTNERDDEKLIRSFWEKALPYLTETYSH